MNRTTLTMLIIVLAGTLLLSGCTTVEYVTITDTTTLSAVTVTETLTTTFKQEQYSYMVGDAIVMYATAVLEDRGLLDLIAGLGNGGDSIDLMFYEAINTEVVEIVQSIIDEIAPGLSLVVSGNVSVTTVVDSLMP